MQMDNDSLDKTLAGMNILIQQRPENLKKVQAKKLVKSNKSKKIREIKHYGEIAFLAVLNFFPVQQIDFWPFFKLQKIGFW